jgi:hypothetical protein
VTAHRRAKGIALDGMLFIVHSVIAALAVPIAASVLRYSILFSIQQFYPYIAVSAGKQMYWILLQTPYFPAQIGIGLLWGFQVGRHYRNRPHDLGVDSTRIGACLVVVVCAAAASGCLRR